MRRGRRIRLLWCVLLICGCDSRPDTLVGDYCAAPPGGIVAVSEASPPGVCPFWRGPCSDDYYTLPALAPEGAVIPVSTEELQGAFAAIDGRTWPRIDGTLEPAEFNDAIRAAAGIDWLLDGLETRPLRVTEVDRGDEPGWRFRSWQLEDPYVGRLRGVTILPDGEGPFPTIVVAHGHTEADWEWIQEFDGWELTRRGFAVVVPTLRVNEAGLAESDVTMWLLRNGMSFAGVRVYEHLLAQKYAASLPEVDPCRMGLVGHSGGAVTSNLTIRVSVGFRSLVTDLISDYYTPMPGGLILDETAPRLNSLRRQINNFEVTHRPILQLGYNYTTEGFPGLDQRPQLYRFIDETVADAQ